MSPLVSFSNKLEVCLLLTLFLLTLHFFIGNKRCVVLSSVFNLCFNPPLHIAKNKLKVCFFDN